MDTALAGLPDRATIPDFSLARAYGADKVAAAYCGAPAGKRPPGVWQHGWISGRRSFHPALIIGGFGSYEAIKATERFWVARKDQEQVLRAHGYRFATAIGLPIVYLPRPAVARIPGSLLVMPVHSLDTTTHQWNFEEYAECIASIRHNFSSVVICVHPVCKEKGYWWPAFERRGFHIVEGAFGGDGNSLARMQHLLETFEFVTTNGYGSHFVYAAFFGAKPSIFGPFARFRAEDYRDVPLYRDVPGILGPTIEACSEPEVRKDYPFLFVEPHRATDHSVWAAAELGADCRATRSELRRLFGWTLKDRLAEAMARNAHRIWQLVLRAKRKAFRLSGLAR
jgi:hypothetical protein